MRPVLIIFFSFVTNCFLGQDIYWGVQAGNFRSDFIGDLHHNKEINLDGSYNFSAGVSTRIGSKYGTNLIVEPGFQFINHEVSGEFAEHSHVSVNTSFKTRMKWAYFNGQFLLSTSPFKAEKQFPLFLIAGLGYRLELAEKVILDEGTTIITTDPSMNPNGPVIPPSYEPFYFADDLNNDVANNQTFWIMGIDIRWLQLEKWRFNTQIKWQFPGNKVEGKYVSFEKETGISFGVVRTFAK